MKKHDYIKMIEGDGSKGNTKDSAHEFWSDIYEPCGRAAGVHHDHTSDTDLDRIPGGYVDDGTADHIFDENREFDGDQT